MNLAPYPAVQASHLPHTSLTPHPMPPRCVLALLTRARQLPQATDEAVLGLASAPRSQNDRMIKLRISCHTTVVRF